MKFSRLSVSDQGQFRKELEKVKQSKNYRMLRSVTNAGKGMTKTFTYHYAEQSQWWLGSGAYGAVYCCFFDEVVTGRVHKFALKVIQVPSGMTEVKKIEDMVATTRQEIMSLVRLRQNPNIIKVQDVIGEDKCRVFIILEYCNNKDLESFFEKERKQGGLQSEEEILFYFKQLLHGIQDLYKYNIIHRDIKPANIFVHNKVLKIGDFGLCQQLFEKETQLQDNRIIGTLQTSSPQIIYKESYTSKCDIYSLGVTLYWMFYQKFPFPRALDKEQFMKFSLNLDQEVHLRPSQEVSHLLRQMLSFREEDRIGWQDLFSHSLFKDIALPYITHQTRDTIGRNLGQNISALLDAQLPSDFAQYVGEDLDSEGMQCVELNESFKKILHETKNFKFKIHFLKLLLKEVWEVRHHQKIKLKVEFSIIRDLLRLGLDTYIIYLFNNFLDELNGLHTLRLFELETLNELSGSKWFKKSIDFFALEVQAYKNSQDKPRLSEEQKKKLASSCQEYGIGDKFHLILGKELLMKDEQQFQEQVKKCIIQLIYFMKEEIHYYASREHNLPKEDEERYRKLVILVHHFNMFIMQRKIFPSHYSLAIKYDLDEFSRHELYENRLAFFQLASKINAIIAKFEI